MPDGMNIAVRYGYCRYAFCTLEISELRRRRQLEEKNQRLKGIVACQALDIRALKD